MSLVCDCPVGTTITAIPKLSCPFSIKQIVMLGFQRLYSTSTTLNQFTIASQSPSVLTDWQALMTATDGTKVQFTPMLANAVIENGELIEYGGDDNSTPLGMTMNMGRKMSKLTAEILNPTPQLHLALKDYECEESAIYIVNEEQNIIASGDTLPTPTIAYPIPIYSFGVSDRMVGGHGQPDKIVISMQLAPNWADMLKKYAPTSFNPFVSLQPAS